MLALANLAFYSPATRPLPDFDSRPATISQPSTAAGINVSRDPITGAPRLVTAAHGFLTAPDVTGKNISAVATDPHRALKTFLNQHTALYGHGAEVLAAATVTRDFTTPHNGLRTTVWQQQVGGITLFDSVLIAHVTKKGELVNLSSQFIPNPAAAAADNSPALTAQQALCLAAKNLGDALAEASLAATSPAVGAELKQQFTAPELRDNATARLVWLPLSATRLTLCWEIVLTGRAHPEAFQVLVDAHTGKALRRHCLTEHISDTTYNVFTSDSPSPFSPGWQTPQSGQPATVARTLVTFSALDTNASPAGWIPDGGTNTLGNNVDAHTDRDANNVADEPRPGSTNRVFDFPLNLASDPTNSSAAAVVQLFYWCNFMHDRLYELGFTEAAGNFQGDNFGRGGFGGDAVQADAQDGSGFNNANMSTYSDGSPPRMQMYLFNGPNPDLDGDFDTEIVLHEYTHGLSNRRVGGGTGIGALQTRGMGEGWSDFYALALLSEEGDDPNAATAMGGYATHQFFGLTQNYYFGIRRYPYSTDLTKNPLTFRDIDPAQASAHAGVPISPISPFSADNANKVHNMGEVWCAALWEARANLIAKYGTTNGNQLILQLVTDGMNLSPANPTFLEARDAILQADEVNYGGANLSELWAAFAKRGMGFDATSPASSTTTGVVESYNLPDDLRISPGGGSLSTGPVGGPFSVTNWSFTLTNTGAAALDWTVTSSTNWLAVSPDGGNLTTGTTVTANLTNAATNLAAGIYTASLHFTNTTSGRSQSRLFTLSVGQPNDYFTELFAANNFDLDHSSITFTPDGGVNLYSACRMATGSFPTDPAGGGSLGLTDDSSAQVTLSGTNSVALYGRRTNVFFVGSNGYITFDDADAGNAAAYASHFSRPRIAALMQDWNPDAAGSITSKELADRIAITYAGVPLYDDTAPNSFQIELFYDGRIRLTWIGISFRNGLTGLSAGQGVPIGFAASDLSTHLSCANAAPVITPFADQTIITGNTAQFGSGANGSVPMNYQWKFHGTNLPAATNATLNLNNVTTNQAGAYALAATNAFGDAISSDATLTVLPPITLAEALDTTNLIWTTGGNNGCLGQSITTHDGTDAAQSGDITHYQESWLQTVVTNSPGTLTFWWKVSSEAGWDYLEFYTNSVLQSGRISGEVGWQQKTYFLPGGSQTLRWRYLKDDSLSSGLDSGWVDEVRFAPDVPLQFLPLQLNGNQLQLRLGSATTATLEAAQAGRIRFYSSADLSLPFASWTLVATPLVFTNGVLELNGLNPTNAAQIFFRARQTP